MYVPDKETFLRKAREGNLIPVWKEFLADQETPVLAYERLRTALGGKDRSAHTFLLESVEGGEHVARYSFIGGEPRAVFRAWGRRVEIKEVGGAVKSYDDVDALSVLRDYVARYRPVTDPELPRFLGGAVGYLGYDAIHQFEPRVPLSPGAGLDWPDMVFAITDTIIIFDRVRHTIKIVANAFVEDDPAAAYERASARIEALRGYLQTPVPTTVLDVREPSEDISFSSNTEPETYKASVDRIKEYIRAGDIIQSVLSQRFETPWTGDALDVYRALRYINPSPYMFCLEFGEQRIVGSSPEIHVRCEDGRIEVRPIAGTRPRSEDPARDQALAEELLADPKERAEHIMLVDLARNDIGRVCAYGTVRVPELMVIERYSHVMHIVSDVIGDLAPDRDAYDVMKATFPAGTVSGAPKIRAMEIIAEQEAERRGPYAGAIGYFSFTGNLDSCITIRTVLLRGDRAYVQAGAGIVADSVPQKELEETQNKARGMLKALALAHRYAEARRGVKS